MPVPRGLPRPWLPSQSRPEPAQLGTNTCSQRRGGGARGRPCRSKESAICASTRPEPCPGPSPLAPLLDHGEEGLSAGKPYGWHLTDGGDASVPGSVSTRLKLSFC